MDFSVKIDTVFISFIVYVMDYPLKKNPNPQWIGSKHIIVSSIYIT